MIDAVNDLHGEYSNGTTDLINIAVFCDGTWQRRGYSSHNGVMNVISMDNGIIFRHRANEQDL